MFSIIKWLIKAAFSIGLVLAIIGATLRFFFVDLAVVGHNGMAPTLVAGDHIAIWRKAELNIGDITICEHPGEPGRYVLGRIIGYAGFVLEGKRGQLDINGTAVQRDFRGEHKFNDTLNNRTEIMRHGYEKLGNTEHLFYERKGGKFQMRMYKIRKGFFLLGDNRTYPGEDSRFYGEVDPTTCLGQVFMRVEPAPSTGDDIDHSWLDIVN